MGTVPHFTCSRVWEETANLPFPVQTPGHSLLPPHTPSTETRSWLVDTHASRSQTQPPSQDQLRPESWLTRQRLRSPPAPTRGPSWWQVGGDALREDDGRCVTWFRVTISTSAWLLCLSETCCVTSLERSPVLSVSWANHAPFSKHRVIMARARVLPSTANTCTIHVNFSGKWLLGSKCCLVGLSVKILEPHECRWGPHKWSRLPDYRLHYCTSPGTKIFHINDWMQNIYF